MEKFDDFLDKMKGLLENAKKNGHIVVRVEDIENAFPVLKESESEDEKIKKALIYHFRCDGCICTNEYRIDNKDIRAWLEKQDSHYTFEIKMGHWYTCVCDYMLNGSDLMFKNGRLYYCRSDWRLESEIDERNVKYIGVNGYKSFFRPATNQEIKDWLEKQGEQSVQNVPSRETILNIWDLANEWKELTSGSISTEHGTQLSYIQKHWQEGEYYLRAKQSEQKYADKLEPKFHKGDWVTDGRVIYQIQTIDENDCLYGVSDEIGTAHVPFEIIEDLYHHWTVQDAKDGDILVCGENKRPFIFRGLIDKLHPDNPVAYCGIDTENEFTIPTDNSWWTDEKVQPATKEQREQLDKAITEELPKRKYPLNGLNLRVLRQVGEKIVDERG